MAPIDGCVFATLLMNDAYLPGAMILGHSLKDRGAKGKLVVFILPENLLPGTIAELKTIYDDVVPVQQIVNTTPANLYLMNRPDLISTFTKIELFKQTQYKRIVYIDADVVALRAPNELLSLDTRFAAVPDIGWPDCFNSGVMVLNPNMADYYSLLALARRGISFDGGDQGLLNMHFTEWERLSFAYNCTPSGNYQYVPAYRHFQSSISLVHFIGKDKPWTLGRQNQYSHGVYGELQGRWWSTYDRHYLQPKTAYYSGQYQDAPKKLQDYVRGEETMYIPGYSSVPVNNDVASTTGPTIPTMEVPGIHVQAPPEDSQSAQERPFGDQPDVAEQIQQHEYEPTPTVQQRRFSAPFAEWQPARQPPPANSKPEAANFPTQTYEMSHSRELFEPPSKYPEPPKDMWYTVPEKSPAPSKPKTIFPWEENARKATRVFPRSREPSPPPVITITPAPASEPSQDLSKQAEAPTSTVTAPEPAPESIKHIFPWEANARKPTRVFPQDKPPSPPTAAPELFGQRGGQDTPSVATDGTDISFESVATPKAPEDPWEAFQSRTNAWDDVPEIAKYMEAINRPRKAGIQVLHHTPSEPMSGDLKSPPIVTERRPSMKLTDFPTAFERPSLPVTPAPIRRPSFWGEDKDTVGDLPVAEGVPKQEEWVRRFSSYPVPIFPAAFSQNINGILHIKCQHCGEQNPVARLEQLQRRQSELLNDPPALGGAKTPPKREMPDSKSKEEVIAAANRALAPPPAPPALKPILKEPSFEIPRDKPSPPSEKETDTEVAPDAPTMSLASRLYREALA